MKVGFIGLGAMGLPMARRVVEAGFETFTTWHRRKEPADALAALGAAVLASPAMVARAADVVVTIVPADAELKAVVAGANGVLEGFGPGKVLIEMTTATAAAMRDVEAAVTAAGGRVLDAPVSGGVTGAANGTLTIMVGGDPALLEECRPLLAAMGTNILHVGGVGLGKVVKMVNQMMAATHLVAMGEAFTLGIRSGADPGTLYEVIRNSSGYSKMMDLRLPGFLFDGSFKPGFTLDLMKKDVYIALESGREQRVPLLITSAVAQILSAASGAGLGGADYSCAAQYLAGLAGVQLTRPAHGSQAAQKGVAK